MIGVSRRTGKHSCMLMTDWRSRYEGVKLASALKKSCLEHRLVSLARGTLFHHVNHDEMQHESLFLITSCCLKHFCA